MCDKKQRGYHSGICLDTVQYTLIYFDANVFYIVYKEADKTSARKYIVCQKHKRNRRGPKPKNNVGPKPKKHGGAKIEKTIGRLQLQRGLFWYRHHPQMHEMDSDRNSQADHWTDIRKVSMRAFSGSNKYPQTALQMFQILKYRTKP